MISQRLKNGLKRPVHLIRCFRAKNATAQLASHDSPKLRAIGGALYELLAKSLSAEERGLLSLIEQRRSFLLKSGKEVAVIDYGAGSPHSNRTRVEMERGVLSTASIAKICKASKPEFWATFLFKLIRKLEPLSCIELGSCVGISASYLGTALTLNKRGALVTLEGAPEIAAIAKETIAGLNLQNTAVVTGPFHETLQGVLESAKPIDFLFNDGHHDHDAVIEYFKLALPNLSDEAVIVFDDISWSPRMREAWNEIQEDRRVTASVDLHTIGIAVVGTDLQRPKEKFRIPL